MSVSRSVLGNWAYSWNFILDSTHNSIMAVDKNGFIVIFNAAARRSLKCTEDVIDRHIREIIPETRLPVVLKTGRPELGKKMMLNNILYLTHRTPILRLGEVIGALEVFEEISYLKNLAEDLCEMPSTSTDGNIIKPQYLPQYLRKHEEQKITERNSLRSILDDTEKTALLQALQATNGNKVKAAKLLGISRAGLYQKLEKYNLLNE